MNLFQFNLSACFSTSIWVHEEYINDVLCSDDYCWQYRLLEYSRRWYTYIIAGVKWLNMSLHELLLSTIWTNDVISIGYETSSYQGCFAGGAIETVVMPMTLFKWNKASSSNSSNWFRAGVASLCKQFPITISTIWLIVLRCKPLSC